MQFNVIFWISISQPYFFGQSAHRFVKDTDMTAHYKMSPHEKGARSYEARAQIFAVHRCVVLTALKHHSLLSLQIYGEIANSCTA